MPDRPITVDIKADKSADSGIIKATKRLMMTKTTANSPISYTTTEGE